MEREDEEGEEGDEGRLGREGADGRGAEQMEGSKDSGSVCSGQLLPCPATFTV